MNSRTYTRTFVRSSTQGLHPKPGELRVQLCESRVDLPSLQEQLRRQHLMIIMHNIRASQHRMKHRNDEASVEAGSVDQRRTPGPNEDRGLLERLTFVPMQQDRYLQRIVLHS
jgi:hypothetical protein